MLNYVNNKIPNKLSEILKSKGLTLADACRSSGLTRPTVQKLVDGEDSFLSKMAILCDSLDISLSEIFGDSQTLHQENHGHDNSRTTMIGYNFQQSNNAHLRQRIKDLEELLRTKDKLIKMYEDKNKIEQQ